MTKPKILLLDIETAPTLTYTWSMFNVNHSVNQIVKHGYMLMWAAKWLGTTKIMWDAIVNYPDAFKKNPSDDFYIADKMWTLMNEADIIIAHNGDNFDIKWLNTVWLKHGFKPIAPIKSIDTLREVRNNFLFISNKLENLVKELSIGFKQDTGGFDLWPDCMEGKPVAWKKMISYCKHDVRLLERLYNKIRPFIKGHPNMGLYAGGDKPRCTNCGSVKTIKRGFAYTAVNRYQRFYCTDCGKYFRGRTTTLSKTERGNIYSGIK